jgi:ParB-like chromosome segregation protein Spo0J
MATKQKVPVTEMDLRDVGTLRTHKRADDIPSPDPDQYDKMVQDIEARGIQVPLDILHDGTVLDGRTRLSIAKALGIALVPVRVIDPPDPYDYMILAAASRRHLSKAQVIALYVKSPSWKKARDKHAAGGEAHGSGETTAGVVAEAVGASDTLVEKVARLQEEPTLLNAVAKGDLSEKQATGIFTDPELRAEIKSGAPVASVAAKLKRQGTRNAEAKAKARADALKDREERLRRLLTNARDLYDQVNMGTITLDHAEEVLDDREEAAFLKDARRNGVDPTASEFKGGPNIGPSRALMALMEEIRSAQPGAVEFHLISIIEACVTSMQKPLPKGMKGFRKTRRETVDVAIARLIKFRDEFAGGASMPGKGPVVDVGDEGAAHGGGHQGPRGTRPPGRGAQGDRASANGST